MFFLPGLNRGVNIHLKGANVQTQVEKLNLSVTYLINLHRYILSTYFLKEKFENFGFLLLYSSRGKSKKIEFADLV
jgi:hypothetical protein